MKKESAFRAFLSIFLKLALERAPHLGSIAKRGAEEPGIREPGL